MSFGHNTVYKKFRLEQLPVKYSNRNIRNILQLYTELGTMLLGYGTYLPTDLQIKIFILCFQEREKQKLSQIREFQQRKMMKASFPKQNFKENYHTIQRLLLGE